MKQFSRLPLLLGFVFSISFTFQCSSNDSEILASFNGGVVTRGDLRSFFELRGVPTKGNSGSVQSQTQALEMLAFQKIAEIDQIQKNKVTAEEVNSIVDAAKGQLLQTLYRKHFIQEATKKQPADLAELQMLMLRRQSEEDNQKIEEIWQKLQTLSSSSEIDAFISENTQDKSRKAIGGRVEPFCLNCASNPLEDILQEVLEAKQGTFVKKEAGEMVYIIRILKRESVVARRLTAYYSDVFKRYKKIADRYLENHNTEEDGQSAQEFTNSPEERGTEYGEHTKRQLEGGLWNKEYERIQKESTFEVSNEIPQIASPKDIKPSQFPPTLVLANTKNGPVTLQNMRDKFASMKSLTQKPGSTEGEQIFDLLNFFFTVYIPGAVLESDEKAQKYAKSADFQTATNLLKTQIYWVFLMKEIQDANVEVTETDIQQTYEAGKFLTYSAPDPRDPSKRIPEPFAKVRDRIRMDLENSKKKDIYEEKISALRSQYQLKLNTSELKDQQI